MTTVDVRLRGAGKTYDLVADVLAAKAPVAVIVCGQGETRWVCDEIIRQVTRDRGSLVLRHRDTEIRIMGRIIKLLAGPTLAELDYCTTRLPVWIDNTDQLRDGVHSPSFRNMDIRWASATPLVPWWKQ